MTVAFIRDRHARNSSWPGELIFQPKAEYICADWSSRPNFPLQSRAADHTCRYLSCQPALSSSQPEQDDRLGLFLLPHRNAGLSEDGYRTCEANSGSTVSQKCRDRARCSTQNLHCRCEGLHCLFPTELAGLYLASPKYVALRRCVALWDSFAHGVGLRPKTRS